MPRPAGGIGQKAFAPPLGAWRRPLHDQRGPLLYPTELPERVLQLKVDTPSVVRPPLSLIHSPRLDNVS